MQMRQCFGAYWSQQTLPVVRHFEFCGFVVMTIFVLPGQFLRKFWTLFGKYLSPQQSVSGSLVHIFHLWACSSQFIQGFFSLAVQHQSRMKNANLCLFNRFRMQVPNVNTQAKPAGESDLKTQMLIGARNGCWHLMTSSSSCLECQA